MEQQTTNAVDVYQIVTDRIIELLEAGTIPWKKPWIEAGLPCNVITKNFYKGINVFLLASLDYEKNLFLTWQQVQENGGKVKKGEKGHVIIFYKKLAPETENTEEVSGTNKVQKSILRYYKVFNVAQCENLPENIIPEMGNDPISPLQQCEEIITNMPNCPKIITKGNEAFYEAVEDFIQMPVKKQFKTKEGYYATLFHELIHSTGHQTRLKRKEVTGKIEFGTKDYSIEELTGEIGAAYLKSFAGIVDDDHVNSAAYIAGWLKVLKNNKRFIFYASSRAQQAVDYILNRKEEVKE